MTLTEAQAVQVLQWKTSLQLTMNTKPVNVIKIAGALNRQGRLFNVCTGPRQPVTTAAGRKILPQATSVCQEEICTKFMAFLTPDLCNILLDKPEKLLYNIIRKREKENKKMTREMIKEEIDKLETRLFFLNMKDRWNGSDYVLHRELNKNIRELKKALDK